MVDQTVMFDAVPDTVEPLRRLGCRLGIVSTKYRYRIEATFSREGLLDAFEVFVGREDVTAHKPDPEGLLKVMATLEITPPRTLYAGDSLTDAQAPARAVVPFVAALSDLTSREAFASSALRWMIEDVSQLPALIASEWYGQGLGPEPEGVTR
jgi:phosphoglycolate phosphatase